MRYAAIYAPDFPVQAVLRAEPELRTFAVAIVDGAPPQETLCAMNEIARRSGVQMGMPRSLLEQCSSLLLRRRSPQLETAAHAAMVAAARECSPRVEETAADTLVLDLAGLEQLFGPPQQIATALMQRITKLDLEARVAVAANPDAAIAAARGFAGVTVIPCGGEAETLGVLPVAALAGLAGDCVTPEILETLGLWGIRDFRSLAALPTAQLSERLGQAGVRLQRLARGAHTRGLLCPDDAPQFSETMELECAVEELEPLAFILNRLLQDICTRLESHALSTNELHLRFTLDVNAAGDAAPAVRATSAVAASFTSPFGSSKLAAKDGEFRLAAAKTTYDKALRLPVPMRDPALLLSLLRLHLAAYPPRAPIVKVTLTAIPAHGRTVQTGFFTPLSPDAQKLEVTLARIAGIVGASNVGAAELLDSHRPEAFQVSHFAAPAFRPASPTVTASAAATTSALRVYRPPLRAAVELRSGAPARISFGGLRGAVRAASGPWRSSGNWWQEEGWQHDVWDIEIELPAPAASGNKRESVRHMHIHENPAHPETRNFPLRVAERKAAGFYRIYLDRAAGEWFVRGEYD